MTAASTKEPEWEVREENYVPRASFDELEIHTSDGAMLRALVDDPPEGRVMRGTLVLAHAMFARKTSFGRRDRPGLSSALTSKGFRTVAFDFRGHGDSTAPASSSSSSSSSWGYDDLVLTDLPAVLDCARARSEDKPVIVVGHSLGGHVALAAQGMGFIAADAIVALGANVWLRELEPSRVRWAAKLAFARATLAVSKKLGGLPARRLRIGSDDASERYLRDLFKTVTSNAWTSSDNNDDYLAALANVKVPVVAVLGGRDRLMCHRVSGEAFVRRCNNADVHVLHAKHANHMELVTSPGSHDAVVEAVEWALRRVTR